MKRTISIMLPTFNEEDNILPLVNSIRNLFQDELNKYNYEIVISDNKSTDTTRSKIRDICNNDKNVKAIFNINNFPIGSGINGLRNTNGDCTIHMASDFQDPVSLLPKMVEKWEEGFKIVLACKSKSKENSFMYKIRGFYYKLMNRICYVKQINQFSGFALYDKSFINVIKDLKDPLPYMRGLVSELGGDLAIIEYEQQLRKSGKSSYSGFLKLYDVAIRGITTYSKIPVRVMVFTGGIGFFILFIFLVVSIVSNLIYSRNIINFVNVGAFILQILFLQMLMLGLLGEYLLNINVRIMDHPIVVEEERINF